MYISNGETNSGVMICNVSIFNEQPTNFRLLFSINNILLLGDFLIRYSNTQIIQTQHLFQYTTHKQTAIY